MESYTTYLAYLKGFKNIPHALPHSGVEKIISRLHYSGSLNGFFPNAPAVFVIDYSKGRYIFFSASIGNYQSSQLIKGGLDFMMPLMQADFFKTYNEEVFPGILSFLKEVPVHLHSDYIISCNHRIKNTDGQDMDILQRSAYLTCHKTGLPLYCVGTATDISHFKPDDKIILSFEKKDTESGTMQRVKTSTFYPYLPKTFLTREETDMLQYICEGLSSKMISEKMYLSPRTIEKRRAKLQQKTKTDNIAQLIAYAFKNKI